MDTLYGSVDWTTIVTIDPNSQVNSATITDIHYNPDTKMLEVTMDYTQDIDSQ